MKKRIISIIIAMLIFPMVALADMSGPGMLGYEAEVTNPKGVECETDEERKFIKYGEQITIIREYYWNDKIYGEVSLEKDSNDYDCDIEISNNVTPIQKVFDLNSKYVGKTNIKGFVINSNSLKMYSGPAYGYEYLNVTIPENTKLTFTYKTYGDEDTSNAWLYTEYNGTKGWVDTLNGVVAFESKKSAISSDSIDIYDNINTGWSDQEESKINKIGTIPKHTKLSKENIYDLDSWSKGYKYVEYNGIKGYIYDDDLVYKCTEDCDYTIIDEYNDLNDYVKCQYDYTENYMKVYTKKLSSIPTGTKVSLLYIEYPDYNCDGKAYIEYNGTSGWIRIKDIYNDEPVRIEIIDNEKPPIENQEEKVIPEQNENKTIKNKDNNNSIRKLNGKEIIILCVGAALILSLTAIVTILLINKKKKKTNKNN